MKTWTLRQGADRRIRSQHPWVFSNELAQSPKDVLAGSPVRLVDAKGQFVAMGYGNPASLIAFRALSFRETSSSCSLEDFVGKAVSAWGHRALLGFQLSFRLLYGEGDFLPGLVIDRYVVEQSDGERAQVLVLQIVTAGLQLNLGASEQMILQFCSRVVEEAELNKLSLFGWARTAVVLRNDSGIRRLEGLLVEPAKILRSLPGLQLDEADILLAPAAGAKPVRMRCDLHQGQKTGFFLDQTANIQIVCNLVRRTKPLGDTVRVLDLCCYVGHWSAQLTRQLHELGYKTETTLVDVSERALSFAKINAEREGALALPQKLDVLEGLSALPDKHYDIVIADPPAFIKAKKDVPTGKHAYLKFNSQAFRMVRRGGLVASCSCSGLFTEEEMMDTLAKALRRQELRGRCVATGGHAPDHPNLASFPEGFYLKMFVHQVCAD